MLGIPREETEDTKQEFGKEIIKTFGVFSLKGPTED